MAAASVEPDREDTMTDEANPFDNFITYEDADGNMGILPHDHRERVSALAAQLYVGMDHKGGVKAMYETLGAEGLERGYVLMVLREAIEWFTKYIVVEAPVTLTPVQTGKLHAFIITFRSISGLQPDMARQLAE